VASNSSNSNISQLMASINQAMFEAEVQAQAQMQAQQEVQQRFLQRQVGRGRGSLPLHTRLCVACC
jgi:signal recognition particle GTPase